MGFRGRRAWLGYFLRLQLNDMIALQMVQVVECNKSIILRLRGVLCSPNASSDNSFLSRCMF